MRRYAAADVRMAFERAGYALAERTLFHHAYLRQADIVILPAPSVDEMYAANEIDQIIADRWVPIAPGSLMER